MKLWYWEPGRQSICDYRKMRLWQFGLARFNKWCDAYLIEYPPAAMLPYHKDPVQKGRHYRLNIALRGKGHFICDDVIFEIGPIVFFRPDINRHCMVNMNSPRLVLSFGFVL